MGSYTISALINIESEPASVMKRLTSTRGISSWWSTTVNGSADSVGDEFTVGFPGSPVDFDFSVVALDENSVSWLSGSHPPPWSGTTIGFSVSADDNGGTNLMFTHSGFDPESETIAVVTPAWMAILGRLKANVEAGTDEAFFQLSNQ